MQTRNKVKTISVSSAKTSPTSVPPSHASKVLIDVDNLSVVYGSEAVLEGVSFCVHRGEFVGLIGPNGAGKTTLLRVMLGLLAPTAGTVRRESRVPSHNITARDRDQVSDADGGQMTIGYVPQRGATYNGILPISVLEIVRLGLDDSGGASSFRWAKREAAMVAAMKAMQALARVDMEAYANKRFTHLSGGQQQRVSIAKALAGNADVLILDEPATGIDEQAQIEFYDLLKELQGQGVTIIMVSHEVDTVLKLVTRVVCLNRTILYDGSPDHFEADKYLPRAYQQRHVRLHHQHGMDDDA